MRKTEEWDERAKIKKLKIDPRGNEDNLSIVRRRRRRTKTKGDRIINSYFWINS